MLLDKMESLINKTEMKGDQKEIEIDELVSYIEKIDI